MESTQAPRHGQDGQHSRFINNTAGRNCNQTNGHLYRGATDDQMKSAIDARGQRYENNTKDYSPGGLQVNGLRVEHSGGLTLTPHLTGGLWDGNMVLDEPAPKPRTLREVISQDGDVGTVPMAEQVNGVYVARTPY